MRNSSGLNGGKKKRKQRWWFNNIWNKILKRLGQKRMFSPAVTLFSQCPAKNFLLNYTVSVSIWMSRPFWGVLSLVSLFRKGVVLRRHAFAIYYSVNQMGAETGQLRESEPPVQSNGGLCGLREYKLQDRTKSEEIDLLDPFPEREAALVLSSFPKGPDLWATLNKQNTVWTLTQGGGCLRSWEMLIPRVAVGW